MVNGQELTSTMAPAASVKIGEMSSKSCLKTIRKPLSNN